MLTLWLPCGRWTILFNTLYIDIICVCVSRHRILPGQIINTPNVRLSNNDHPSPPPTTTIRPTLFALCPCLETPTTIVADPSFHLLHRPIMSFIKITRVGLHYVISLFIIIKCYGYDYRHTGRLYYYNRFADEKSASDQHPCGKYYYYIPCAVPLVSFPDEGLPHGAVGGRTRGGCKRCKAADKDYRYISTAMHARLLIAPPPSSSTDNRARVHGKITDVSRRDGSAEGEALFI